MALKIKEMGKSLNKEAKPRFGDVERERERVSCMKRKILTGRKGQD